jgi:hypothetical protein
MDVCLKGALMNKKIGLSDVKIEWLNKRALVLTSIFAHAANKLENHVIDLRSDDVLSQVSDLAKTSGNAELLDIYDRIKREIKVSLSEKNTTVEAAKAVAKLSVYDSPSKNSSAELHNRYRPL